MKTFYQISVLFSLMSFAMILPAATTIKPSSSFTQQVKLTVSAVRVTEIKSNQARCSFTVQGSPINEKGVCFSEQPTPTISSKKSMAPGNPANTGISIMGGLKPATTYYVRAYAKSGSVVFYGNELNFKTATATDPPKNSQNTVQKVDPKTGGSK